MILVDTSAWLEFDRGTGSAVDQRLTMLIAETDLVAVTEPVVMEVVAAARDEVREGELQRLMRRCALLPFDPVIDFDAAARIHRRCRRDGLNAHLTHCLVASVALRRGASLLATDSDLAQVADTMGVARDAA